MQRIEVEFTLVVPAKAGTRSPPAPIVEQRRLPHRFNERTRRMGPGLRRDDEGREARKPGTKVSCIEIKNRKGTSLKTI